MIKEEKKVYEVKKTFIREVSEVRIERFILERNEDGIWFFNAPNQSLYYQEEIEEILHKLKELNKK